MTTMLKSWTIGRATGTGIVAGLAALMLWPAYAAWQEPVRLAYLGALAVAGLCGVSILAITVGDLILHRRRGARLVPIRTFDVVIGLLLAVPSLAAFAAILPEALAG